MTADQTRNPVPTSARRYSISVVIGAALAGMALGALAVFAMAAPTWKLRIEFPQPPYPPPLTSTPLVTYLPPPPVSTTMPESTTFAPPIRPPHP
jgi:hypothetical protein